MEWLDDLRNLYKTLGLDNKKIVFSFSDKEIREESFIEDINNILNVGELTSLFTAEDEDDNHSEIEMQLKKAKVRDTSQEATHNFFIKRCKRNLHLLLFMSPAGNQLQNYFRKYPSLVNCTSIDWFLNWPTEALQAVSDHYLLKLHGIIYESTQTLSQYKSTGAGEQHKPGENSTQQRALETIAEGFEDRDDGSVVDKIITERRKSTRTQNEIVQELPMTTPNLMDEEMIDSEVQEIAQMPLRERISNIFTQIHESAMELVETYALETKRQVYVTPVMFMNVFELFGQVLARKNEEIERERSKYEQGVRKLEQAKIMIENMEETLTQLQPRLVAKTKEVEKLVKELDKESARVTEIKEVVDTETAEAEIKKQKADQLKAHCEMKLNKAQPLFDKAIKALRTLSSSDFVVLKSFQNPPPGVRLALEGCCVMLGIAPVYKKVDGVKVADYWDKSKKLTKNYKSLLDQLENYNKENISPAIIEKIQPYLENPAFQPDQVKSASNAAEGLCKWVIAITEFDKVYKEITPKRRSLEEAEETVRITQAELQIKQEQLNQLQEQLAQLQAMNMERQQEKADLLRERADAQSKLERANALMQSIGSEKDRWIATKSKLAEDKLSLLGDMILASCFVNYLGPFEGTYRMRLINESWTKLNTKYQIKFSEDFVLRDILGDVEKISDWTLRGLPNENTAYENMIIIDETIEKKYPVIIDPQGQAFRYMRDNIGQTDAGSQNSQNRVCLKASAPNSTKILLNALEYGSVVFCENAGEVTNPQLLSILRKDLQTIQSDLYIVYNDQTVRFDIDFRLYVFSHLSNPHFSPEVQQLSKVLNFSVTREGLEQQLLQIICRHELSREEEDRERYAKQTIQLSKRKRQVFDKILATLRNSGDEILESDGFVKQLNESKETTTEIEKKLKQAKNNEDKIRDLREKFEVTAKQGARLYFAVQDLQLLDNMYQFSMSWFRGLFSQTFVVQQEQNSDEESKSQAEEDGDDVGAKKHRPTGRVPTNDLTKKQKLEEMTKRAAILKTQFREILFRNVCMSLFEHHKLLFAFYISLKVYENDKTFQEGLDRLEKQPDRKPKENSKLEPSRFDNSSKVSDQKSSNNKEQSNAQSIAQTRVSMPRNSKQGRGVLSRHNDSDQMTAINEERELQQKEEDKKLAIDATLLKFTLTGLMLSEAEPYVVVDNTRPDLFTDAMWSQLHQLTSFACLETLLENIISDFASWEKFMHCDKGEQAFELLPEPYQSTLPHFAWIPLVRCIKPELTTAAIRRYVQKSLGKFFITPIIFHVKDAFNDSKYHTPLLLILTPGNDPMEQIKKLSEEKQRTVTHVSLGKGQGEKAKQLIKKYKLGAGWIVLQNCHLSKSFLPELEQIIEGLQPQTGAVTQGSAATIDYEIEKKDVTHPDFRIWLTSMSVDYFPQMLLQQSLKITSEPPKGIKSSMIRAYAALKSSKTEQEFYSANKKQEIWQKLYLSLSFFHAIVRERKRFGALGWTTQYDFNDSDFRVSMRQLYLMVETFDQVPFKALRYLTGLCNYGGRVTDDRDRRTLATLLNDFYNEDVIEHKTYFIVNEKFKKYYIHSGETWKDYQGFVQGLPDEESPMLMGLHDNAIIQQAINEANTIFQNTLKLTNSSQSNDSGSSAEESTSLVRKMTRDILDKIREPFKIKEVEKKYPFNYLDSMNSVLLQELARYNTLIETIRESLNVMLMTLEGKLVFNAETDELLTSIKNNIIPEKWKKKSYPSMKPLLAYIEDLKKRLGVFEEWIEKGKPNCFWISGFFFTQSFLTGVKQNYARKNQYPIDKVEFTYDVLKFSEEAMAHSLAPVNGCYLSGLYIEGAAWDDANGILRESDPKIIHVSLPVMHFIPKYQLSPGSHDPGIPAELSVESSEPVSAEISSIHQPQRFIYECPTYKTSERAGQLLTTGHNTNYIQMIDLPSGQEPSLWIRRGVALLCQLDH